MKLNRADAIKAKELSEKHNVDEDIVKLVISSQYEFIKKTTKELDLPPELSKLEFGELKTNFNIPSIGKLYASYFMYNELNKRKKKKLG